MQQPTTLRKHSPMPTQADSPLPKSNSNNHPQITSPIMMLPTTTTTMVATMMAVQVLAVMQELAMVLRDLPSTEHAKAS